MMVCLVYIKDIWYMPFVAMFDSLILLFLARLNVLLVDVYCVSLSISRGTATLLQTSSTAQKNPIKTTPLKNQRRR